MAKRVVRLGPGTQGFDIVSYGCAGSQRRSFSRGEIEQIARTVRKTPEVMVKVTGGGTNAGAVAAHLRYISRRGELNIETDDGQRVAGREAQKLLLDEWHLELIAGQYRPAKASGITSRSTKLVHNIVLSMPAPTSPDKVRTAAARFAREKFGLRHRYAMALHADQANPHVHLVVKAESELGQRLHIDKAMLREWREDFARLMREQGVAANATPRAIRGVNKGKIRTGIYNARRHGRSTAVERRVNGIVKELASTGRIQDPERQKLQATRKTLIESWFKAAEALDRQGEIELAGDVRYFALHLPTVFTDREQLAAQFIRFSKQRRATQRDESQRRGDPEQEFTR